MDKSNTTGSITGDYLGTSYSYTNGYCAYRLPCGYCSMRQMMCPVCTCWPQYKWNEVTCQTTSQNAKEN